MFHSKKKKTSTTPFKLIYAAMVSIMSVVLVLGSMAMQDDPRFKGPALIAGAKGMFYVASFRAENAFGAANTISGIQGEEGASIGGRGSVPVLVYHGILSRADGSRINLTEEQFKDQMFALRRAGYTSITLEELYAFAKEGKELPEKPVMITFDDGRADSFYNGDPILDAVDYTAVMFAISKYARAAENGTYYLSPEELKLMQRSGRWEIGSHSDQGHEQYTITEHGEMGNFYSNHLWKEDEGRAETADEFRARIRTDFEDSRRYFEDLTGISIVSFAFPFGDLGQNQKDAREKTQDITSIASDVYKLLFYQYRPGEYYTQVSPQDGGGSLLARRIDMDNTWDAARLLDVLEDGTAKALPYHDSFDEDHGWLKVWGDHSIEGGSLRLQASPLQTGASTVIDGSAHWEDYTVRADVISPERTGVFLWTRFQDDDHNAGCNFGTEFVHAEQVVGGEKRVLQGVRRAQSIPEGPFSVSAEVVGRTLVCSINGEEIVRTEFLDESLDHGGTGVKIWDEALGKSTIEITQLEVVPIK
jgi:peptidoglycan/xylan/chitin deacetylase (PgdA/CDA1 family)